MATFKQVMTGAAIVAVLGVAGYHTWIKGKVDSAIEFLCSDNGGLGYVGEGKRGTADARVFHNMAYRETTKGAVKDALWEARTGQPMGKIFSIDPDYQDARVVRTTVGGLQYHVRVEGPLWGRESTLDVGRAARDGCDLRTVEGKANGAIDVANAERRVQAALAGH